MARATRPCPACECTDCRPAFAVDGYDLVECTRCKTLLVSPLPDEATIREVYVQPDYHHGVEESAPRMRAEARARVKLIVERGCKRLLEIGCGAGYFLDACGEAGIEAEGVDGSPTAARARARGLVVHDTWVNDFEPVGRYDAVALWEVIEHLPQPSSVLRRLRTFVRKDGTLALSTPSWSGLPAKALGRRFPMITPPEHLTLFSRRGLHGLLERAGFDPYRTTSFSALDSEALARNLQRYFLGESRAGSLAARMLGSAATIPMRLVDRAGYGTSFELYARAT